MLYPCSRSENPPIAFHLSSLHTAQPRAEIPSSPPLLTYNSQLKTLLSRASLANAKQPFLQREDGRLAEGFAV